MKKLKTFIHKREKTKFVLCLCFEFLTKTAKKIRKIYYVTIKLTN